MSSIFYISAGVISHFVRIYPDKSEKTDPVTAETPDENKPIAIATAPWKSALKMTWKISSKAVFFAFCSSLLIQWLDHQRVFNALPLDPTLFGIPQESLKILAAWFAHVYAGMGMAGQMTTNGDFSQLEVFRTCLFCAIASRPIFFIKEAPGYYFGLFGPKVGLCLFAYHMSALLINGSIVLFLTGLYH